MPAVNAVTPMLMLNSDASVRSLELAPWRKWMESCTRLLPLPELVPVPPPNSHCRFLLFTHTSGLLAVPAGHHTLPVPVFVELCRPVAEKSRGSLSASPFSL